MLATKSSGRVRAGSITAAIVSIVVLAIAALLYLNRQYFSDQLVVWSYEPTAAIQDVSTRVAFSDKGKFYFYVTQPEIATADTFNQDCPRQEPSSPILGCYSNGRIFVYDITNQQLDGIEEVTAAHEMLHAAWERLSDTEKDRLSGLLKTEYAKHATGTLAERMAYYERNEPGELVNELHSILPTEITTLSPELEAYYAQYFQDRQKVVSLHNQYNTVLEGLRTKVEGLYDQLMMLSASIESTTRTYEVQAATLSTDIDQFNARAQSGGFTTQQQFAAERSTLTARAAQIQTNRNAINTDIDRYNGLYTEYKQVAGELDSLNKSLDSITTIPQSPTIEE